MYIGFRTNQNAQGYTKVCKLNRKCTSGSGQIAACWKAGNHIHTEGSGEQEKEQLNTLGQRWSLRVTNQAQEPKSLNCWHAGIPAQYIEASVSVIFATLTASLITTGGSIARLRRMFAKAPVCFSIAGMASANKRGLCTVQNEA